MTTIDNLICLTPCESYLADESLRSRGLLRRLERRIGPFVRSPGIGFPYMVGFLRKQGVLTSATRVVVQHDKIEGITPFEEILRDKVDPNGGGHDVLFVTAYTNSAREAYRRAREARAAYAQAGRKLTVVMGGAHASAVPDEGTRWGHVDATVVGEGEWAAAELFNDIREGRSVKPVYQEGFARIRDRGTLTLDMSIWQGLSNRPQQIVASATLARGCKLRCHFCAVFLTNGPTIRNRDVGDVVDELRNQGPRYTRQTIDQAGPGIYNTLLRTLVKTPFVGARYGDRLIASMGPGFTDRYFFWDDNLYNAPGTFKAVCEAIRPLGRPWSAELTIDIADKPDLLKLAYESGCRDLFFGIESVSQQAIDGLDKWSNDTGSVRERVKRVHDAGIRVMGAFVFGLDGDDTTCFDKTLEFLYDAKIDYVVANIIQPYPGTGTYKDAVAGNEFLPCTRCPDDSDTAMDLNWPLFDGAHVLVRPKGMSVEQLQEGYFYFLREAYSLTGIMRRCQDSAGISSVAGSHMMRNYFLSRHGMHNLAYAIRHKPDKAVSLASTAPDAVPQRTLDVPAPARPAAALQPVVIRQSVEQGPARIAP